MAYHTSGEPVGRRDGVKSKHIKSDLVSSFHWSGHREVGIVGCYRYTPT